FFLVDDSYAQLLRFLQLRTGLFSGDDVIGVFAHTATYLAAGSFDFGCGFVAFEVGQSAGEDKSFSGKSGAARDCLALVQFGFEGQASLAQPLEELPVARV